MRVVFREHRPREALAVGLRLDATAFLANRFDERRDADTQWAAHVALVELEDEHLLAGALQDALEFVADDGVMAATEARDVPEFEMRVGGDDFRGRIQRGLRVAAHAHAQVAEVNLVEPG